MKTTLNKIKAIEMHDGSWTRLLRGLGKTQADDEPISIVQILDICGLHDALWCLRAVEGHDREIHLLAVAYARPVQHLMTDPRSVAVLDVAERHAIGLATDDELEAAWDAAFAAVCNADSAASAAAKAAAWAASADGDTTCSAARAAEGAAAWAAAAGDTDCAAQENRLRVVCAEIDALEAA